jgi:hypothetical protein
MHCHVADHINAGMKAMYFVKQASGAEGTPLLSGVKADSGGTLRWPAWHGAAAGWWGERAGGGAGVRSGKELLPG